MNSKFYHAAPRFPAVSPKISCKNRVGGLTPQVLHVQLIVLCRFNGCVVRSWRNAFPPLCAGIIFVDVYILLGYSFDIAENKCFGSQARVYAPRS
ncbi:hypothetical protein BDR04DRAFT_758855 [Suillus decipiens]|nr:hypothetical protein BDR04DRAFT_758855 [Suillus decipiens]